MDAPSGIEVTDNGDITANGPAGVATYRYVMLRRALKSEIETGMKFMRGSIVNALREEGITNARNKRQAYLDLDAAMVAAGYVTAGPLKS